MKFGYAKSKEYNAQEKVESLKNLSTERGVVMHQTNIDIEQVKSQLLTFTGQTSLSIIGAIDA